jgi:hypothetical protein
VLKYIVSLYRYNETKEEKGRFINSSISNHDCAKIDTIVPLSTYLQQLPVSETNDKKHIDLL